MYRVAVLEVDRPPCLLASHSILSKADGCPLSVRRSRACKCCVKEAGQPLHGCKMEGPATHVVSQQPSVVLRCSSGIFSLADPHIVATVHVKEACIEAPRVKSNRRNLTTSTTC